MIVSPALAREARDKRDGLPLRFHLQEVAASETRTSQWVARACRSSRRGVPGSAPSCGSQEAVPGLGILPYAPRPVAADEESMAVGWLDGIVPALGLDVFSPGRGRMHGPYGAFAARRAQERPNACTWSVSSSRARRCLRTGSVGAAAPSRQRDHISEGDVPHSQSRRVDGAQPARPIPVSKPTVPDCINDTTVPPAEPLARTGQVRPITQALVILACTSEPHRAGEVAYLPEDGSVLYVGRGDEEPETRAAFHPQQPGKHPIAAPLRGRGLSRLAAAMRLGREGVLFERVGSSPMLVNGEAVEKGRGELVPGHVMQFPGRGSRSCASRARGPCRRSSTSP